MEIYIFIYIVCLLSVLTYPKTDYMGILILFLLCFISMFRGETVGIDTENYYNNLFSADYSTELVVSNHDFEFFFIGFCDFVRNYGLDPRCCLYFLSFITFLFLGLTARGHDVSLTYVCFFYLLFNDYALSLNIARQMAVCSIVLYAYSYLEFYNYRKYFFFLFILLASSIHASAIFFSVLFFIRNISFHRYIPELKLLVIAIVTYASLQFFKTFILDRILNSLGLISIYSALGEDTSSTTLSLFGFFYRMIGVIIGVHVFSELKDVCWNKILDVFLVGIFIRILLSPFYGNIGRLGLYLYITDVIVFSLYFLYYYKRSDNLRLVEFLCVVFYYSIEYFGVLVGNTYETVPYVISL